jgi:phage N-6-adenine-methyltransferase
MNNVHFMSSTDQWATPQGFFDELNKEFNFDLDPCADSSNHKCERYFTKEQDGLKMDWGGVHGVLQPAIRQRNWKMGKEGSGVWHHGSYVIASTN